MLLTPFFTYFFRLKYVRISAYLFYAAEYGDRFFQRISNTIRRAYATSAYDMRMTHPGLLPAVISYGKVELPR